MVVRCGISFPYNWVRSFEDALLSKVETDGKQGQSRQFSGPASEFESGSHFGDGGFTEPSRSSAVPGGGCVVFCYSRFILRLFVSLGRKCLNVRTSPSCA